VVRRGVAHRAQDTRSVFHPRIVRLKKSSSVFRLRAAMVYEHYNLILAGPEHPIGGSDFGERDRTTKGRQRHHCRFVLYPGERSLW